MKVWYDACTGKHMRYGAAIAKRLRNSGYEVILTTREHPETLALARALGENPIVVGKYRPDSLFSRLEESANRIIEFCKLFKDHLPDVAVAHQSVELCRTAFGLGIPIILTADTPHATAVNKLTLPFASVLVVSEALPKRFPSKYNPDRVVWFKGVDEVAWIRGLNFGKKVSGLKKPLIVVREFETKAAYAIGKPDVTAEIARKLEAFGEVLFLRRYAKSESEFVDSAQLVSHADIVISAGGTISREAALQGVPSIVISELGRTYVNTYLARKGFPIFMTRVDKVLDFVAKYLGQKFDVATKLAKFENPVDVIEKAITDICS